MKDFFKNKHKRTKRIKHKNTTHKNLKKYAMFEINIFSKRLSFAKKNFKPPAPFIP